MPSNDRMLEILLLGATPGLGIGRLLLSWVKNKNKSFHLFLLFSSQLRGKMQGVDAVYCSGIGHQFKFRFRWSGVGSYGLNTKSKSNFTLQVCANTFSSFLFSFQEALSNLFLFWFSLSRL
jgi:hypothetical protein